MYDKESVYDEKVAPLMREITEICKTEGLPFNAQFYLKQEREDSECENDAMFCLTVIPCSNDMYVEHQEHMRFVAEAMKYGKNGKPYIFAASVRQS